MDEGDERRPFRSGLTFDTHLRAGNNCGVGMHIYQGKTEQMNACSSQQGEVIRFKEKGIKYITRLALHSSKP